VPAVGAWSHVVTTWSANEGARLYVNGKLAATAAPRSAAERHRDAPASPAYLFFGGDNGARCWTQSVEPGAFDGAIDDIRVYDYALEPKQVIDDMRAND
jgi:hypothetical protein